MEIHEGQTEEHRGIRGIGIVSYGLNFQPWVIGMSGEVMRFAYTFPVSEEN